jgi:hypothetical protein
MNNFFKPLLIVFLFFVFHDGSAQVGVNATGVAPDPKAMLDINSTTKGFLWPRMTLVQRNAISSAPGITPEGLTVFDTDTKNLWIWRNAAWQAYLPSPWEISGTNIFNANAGSVLIGSFTPSIAPNKLYVLADGMDGIRASSNTGCSLCAQNTVGSAVSGNATSSGVGGYFSSTSGQSLVTGSGNVGIGTFSPSQKVDIDGQIRIRGGSPAAGKVLTSTADGTGSWETPTIATHNHLGEVWSSNFTGSGLELNNSNSTTNSAAIVGRMTGSGTAQNTGVLGTSASALGRGILGINTSDSFTGLPGINAGVSGTAGTGIGVHGNSVSGPSIFGIKTATTGTGNAGLFQNNSTGNPDATVLISNTNNSLTALELRNGYLKVSGTNKTAFIITAGSGGSTVAGNRVQFSYPDMSPTDILIVNHQYVGANIGAIGNWYETGILAPVNKWTIFREDNLPMPVGEKFTVLVIKQ